MNKTIAFLVCIVLSAVLFVSPAAAFQHYWSQQHCAPTAADTMNLQIYLKWSNMEMLNSYVHDGETKGLPFDLDSVTEIAEAQQMWRFVLRPSQESMQAVQGRMTSAGFVDEHCTQAWDSFHCKNVPVTVVAAMFNVEMCAFTQRTSRIVEAAPHLVGRLSTGTYWLANVKKAALKDAHIQYVGGVALFDPTVVPRRHEVIPETKKKQVTRVGRVRDQPTIPVEPFFWPLYASNGPVVLMGLGLPQFGGLADLGVVQVALYCKDGSISNMTLSPTGALAQTCPQNVAYPKSLIVTIPELSASVAVDFNDANCMNYEEFDVLGNIPYAYQSVCSVNAHSMIANLEVWGVYHIQAITVFSDGSHSNTTLMKSFWNNAYQDDMMVTNPNPMTPADIRTLYQLDAGERLMNNESAQGILEFSDTLQPGRGFELADLKMFLTQYNVVSVAEVDAYLAKWLVRIGGDQYESRGETSLDIEMMMSLAQTAKTYLWNIVNGPGLEYVHWSQAFLAWGYNVTSGTGPSSALPPSVWSISYGGPEWDTPNDSADDAEALNNYFKLMTASGVTVAVSSGDSGAGFFFGTYTQSPLVSYPASSPYVVAVGATATERNADTHEVSQVVCSTAMGNVITSGGGFSTNFGLPSYQADVVNAYVVNHTKSGHMLPIGVRGVPDVAAIGAWVNIVMSQETIPVFGTSISAPVFSSLLSLANDRRRANGNGTVRLANWMVYRAPEGVFVDVVSGSNCAGEQYQFSANFPTYPANTCFQAGKGWDAVSGIGMPMYPQFAAYALNWTASGIVLPSTGSSGSSHAGAIAGGVVGGVVGLAIVGFIIFKCTRKPEGADYQAI